MTHNKAIVQLLHEYQSADKRRYTDIFLSALNGTHWNSGLYAYAAMQNFPKHDYTTENPGSSEDEKRITPCDICSSYLENIDDESDYHEYYFVDGLNADSIYERLYIISYINRLEDDFAVTQKNFDTFSELMLCLKNAEPSAGIRDIFKLLKKRMKGIAEDKIQAILETLGICGILSAKKYKSPFHKYINLAVAPRSSRSSDWAYPVDFWRGSDGIDREALIYWFGSYQELQHIL